jgi:hypothetical protein
LSINSKIENYVFVKKNVNFDTIVTQINKGGASLCALVKLILDEYKLMKE